eukprot:gene7725-12195_t
MEATEEGNKVNLTYEMIQKNFRYSIDVASQNLGVTKEYLNESCRKNGIKRWPYRKGMRSLEIVGKQDSQGITKNAFMLNLEAAESFKDAINKKLKRKETIPNQSVKPLEIEKPSLSKIEKIEKPRKMELKNILN